jgi:MinD superfamily P-loop ATPase
MNVPVLGIIENMSTFVCPHCGKETNIFAGMGIEKAAKDFNLDILGNIPIDVDIVKTGDSGNSYLESFQDSQPAKEFKKIVQKIIQKMK